MLLENNETLLFMPSTFFSVRYTVLEIIKSWRIHQSCYYMYALPNFSLE
jgi:hypothetical protein